MISGGRRRYLALSLLAISSVTRVNCNPVLGRALASTDLAPADSQAVDVGLHRSLAAGMSSSAEGPWESTAAEPCCFFL